MKIKLNSEENKEEVSVNTTTRRNNMPRFVTLDPAESDSAKLKVVGVGGGGCNAIESMMKRGLTGVEYVAINTDAQALQLSGANQKIQIGTNITRGLGAGADPTIGHKALEEDREKIESVLKGSDMVFVTAGMGGGTGTGAAPTVAAIAKSVGALVVGIVTKPFKWEGPRRIKNAEAGIHELRRNVDSLIVIPNDRLLSILDGNASADSAFDKPNEVLYEATRGIADIITIPGIINVDFADVRSVMNESGEALMGCGIASGENRAIEAAQKAISSPLLEDMNIKGAKNILLNVTASSDLTMKEIEAGNQIIYETAGDEANIIFGWVLRDDMNEYVSYTVIATGFNNKEERPRKKMEVEEVEPESDFIIDTPGGGFDLDEEVVNDPDLLSVPTIQRLSAKKKKAPVANENTNKNNPGIRMSFQPKGMNDFDFDDEKKENAIEEDDSSSFLNMMMD
jgi:cell division protein FtsZ